MLPHAQLSTFQVKEYEKLLNDQQNDSINQILSQSLLPQNISPPLSQSLLPQNNDRI